MMIRMIIIMVMCLLYKVVWHDNSPETGLGNVCKYKYTCAWTWTWTCILSYLLTYLSLSPSLSPSINQSISSIHPSVSPSVRPFVHPSIHPSICPVSVCLSIYLFIYLIWDLSPWSLEQLSAMSCIQFSISPPQNKRRNIFRSWSYRKYFLLYLNNKRGGKHFSVRTSKPVNNIYFYVMLYVEPVAWASTAWCIKLRLSTWAKGCVNLFKCYIQFKLERLTVDLSN